MAVMYDLPPELLDKIAAFCRIKDLPALRLSCMKLQQAANKEFATFHFRERCHVISAYSLTALLHITSHHFFGPFVQSIKLHCVCYPDGMYWNSSTDEEHAVGPSIGKMRLTEEFIEIMKRIFRNIRKHRQSVSVGTYAADVNGGRSRPDHPSFGLINLLRIQRADSSPQYCFSTTLAASLITALESGCVVEKLVAEFHGLEFLRRNEPEVRFLPDVVLSFLRQRSLRLPFYPYAASGPLPDALTLLDTPTELSDAVSALSLDLDVMDESECHYIEFNHKTGRLSACLFHHFETDPRREDIYQWQDALMLGVVNSPWLASIPVKHLQLDDYFIDDFRHFTSLFFEPYLENLEQIQLFSIFLDDHVDWSNPIRYLSSAPKLKYCTLQWLRTEIVDLLINNRRVILEVKTYIFKGEDVGYQLRKLADGLDSDTARWFAPTRTEECELQYTSISRYSYR